MDVLDNILPLMDKGGAKKVKKEETKDTKVQSPSSFRIPKKSRDASQSASGQQIHEANNTGSVQMRSERPPLRGDTRSGPENKPWNASLNMSRFDTSQRTNFVIPRTIMIEMNGLAVDLSNAVESVDRYHVTIVQVRGQKEKDATQGPKNDIAFQHRRRALFTIVRQVMKMNQENFGTNRYAHVYDLGNTLYSIGCSISSTDGEQTYCLNAADISSSFAQSFFGGERLTKMLVTFVHTGKVYLKGPGLYESDSSFRETQKFFEVLSSQVLYEGDYLGYMNKFYEKSQENDKKLGDGKCVKNGFEKNVRILGDSIESATPVLQTDTKKSPFFSEQDVLSFISELFSRDPDIALSEKSAQKKVASELRNVVVTTTHLDNNRSFFIHGLSETSSKTQVCPYNGETVSVEDYFLLKYKLRLKYPNLPLAVERKPSSQSFHPLELLKIERGQRVETKKLSGRLTEKMISECRVLPHEMRRHNIEQLAKAKLISTTNRYLESFKVKTDDKFITSEAKVLSAPEIKYKHEIVRPCNVGPIQNWRVSNFIVPANVRNVSITIFDQCMRHEDARTFFSAICRLARQRGVQIKDEGAQVADLPSEADELIEQHFKRCRKNNVDIIICLTREKKDSVHDLLKLLETRFLIVTQHIHVQTALKCNQPRGGIKTIENLLLKFNIKLGGVNHSIQIPNQALVRGFSQQDMYNKLFGGRMFVGFELSHASAQSRFDRQFGVAVGEPTVIGIAYTLGTLPTDLGGFYWFQQARLHKIQYLDNQFLRPLEEFHKKCNELPREIIIYRSGASEGEYDEVSSEASMIYRACASCCSLNRGRPYTPKLVIIVAQTKSNYRVIPADLTINKPNVRAIDVNVPSGTCADQGIVSIKYKEFVMASQQANIGTSRPTRYTVVVDSEPQIPLEEVEHLTHWLAHAHQASTLPTHVPGVLYSAKNLAKRGRANWKAKTMENSDASSSSSDPRIQVQEGESADKFYERMSRELNASLPGQFWG